ncbi:MAG TPA: ATP-binding cassette domain-containing protein [Thermoanaerobaculia bacterium]|jgi:phosphate transport system ATP-binding protein|nr:ATP-binding cassette domain-containing protein [Thermoanaerobaculia bacterium]
MLDALRIPEARPRSSAAPVLAVRGLSVTAGGRRQVLRDIDLDIAPGSVLCIIGPSGAGKTTLLRCLNRLVDLVPDLTVSGDVRFHGAPIYARGVDVDALRARIGMIFQQPAVFPGSIADNVLFGVRHTGRLPRRALPERLERALREAALWSEVAHRLDERAASLSVGQQQRLCLARALAGEPEVLLLDEPTSALDPQSTEAIEELILRLRERHAVVLVTHNLGQAERLADSVACLTVRSDGAGELEPR